MDLLDPEEEKVDRPLKQHSFLAQISNLKARVWNMQSFRPQVLDQNLLSTDKKMFRGDITIPLGEGCIDNHK